MARVCQFQEINFFELRYYNYNRICLSFVGLWPYNAPKVRFIRVVFVSFALLLCLILQVITMIKVDDYDVFVEVLSNFLLFLIGVCIYYNSVFNMSKISYMFEFIKRDWLKPKTTKQLEIMKKYAEIDRIYTFILFALCYMVIIVTMFVSLAPICLDIIFPLNTTRPRALPFPIEMLFDVQEHFLPSLFILCSLVSYFTWAAVTNYTMYIIVIQYICGTLRVIGSMLDDAIDVQTVSIHDHNSEARAYGMIVRSIKYHNEILEFIATLNNTIEYAIMPIIFISVIFIMTAFLRLLQSDILEHQHMRETIISIANIVFNGGTLCISNFMGQKIIDHTASLFDKAYNIPWYMLFNRKKSKLLVCFIMMRSLKPSSVMIANIFSLSVKFSASIIQTALSYALIVYSLR